MESNLWQDIKQHPQAMLISIALHLALGILLVMNLSQSERPRLPNTPKVKTIQAVVVDAAAVNAELNKLKQTEQRRQQKQQQRKQQLKREMEQARKARLKEEKRLAELKRQQKLKQKQAQANQAKLEAERKKKQQELEKITKQRQAEQQRLAALAAKRKAEEDAARNKQQAEQAEARRKAEEQELKRRLAEEEVRESENNARLQNLRHQYARTIERQVASNWLPPASMTKGWFCEVMVQQNRLGDVTRIQMVKCSGSEAFKNTVERAVRKASPLPPPPSPDVFDQTLQFTFRPEI